VLFRSLFCRICLLVVIFFICGAIISTLAISSKNDWPIIGVFTQPSSSTEGNCNGKCLYLAASYVKYLEAAGARVVPVNYYATNAEIDNLVGSLNGFFFPGGGSSFPSSAQYLFDKVVAANKNGNFLPLWGTCMGFQWLLIAASKNSNILDPKNGQMDSYNLSIPLDFVSGSIATQSKLFGSAPSDIVDILATQNVTMNNHHYGIFTEHFQSTTSLSSFFRLISTNKDRQGVEFVSTIESFDYPIFGSQWHPEKNGFEWGKTNGIPNEAINHSPPSIAIAQYTADFFVQQARQNTQAYSNAAAEDAALIENYAASKTTGSFMSTYFFHF